MEKQTKNVFRFAKNIGKMICFEKHDENGEGDITMKKEDILKTRRFVHLVLFSITCSIEYVYRYYTEYFTVFVKSPFSWCELTNIQEKIES